MPVSITLSLIFVFFVSLFSVCPAVHCSSVEGVLSDHMTFRLLSGWPEEFGSMVMLECSAGYYLGAGHRTLRCRANGSWEGAQDLATCKSK